MKIRTGFVTNSSSYSSAEIKIDNPVLLKILKKYKDIEALDYIDLGNGVGDALEISESESASYAYDYPTALEDVVWSLMSMIRELNERDGYDNTERIKELEDEINNNIEKIDDGYNYVKWFYSDDSYGECERQGGGCFIYDPTKKKAKFFKSWNGNDLARLDENDKLTVLKNEYSEE